MARCLTQLSPQLKILISTGGTRLIHSPILFMRATLTLRAKPAPVNPIFLVHMRKNPAAVVPIPERIKSALKHPQRTRPVIRFFTKPPPGRKVSSHSAVPFSTAHTQEMQIVRSRKVVDFWVERFRPTVPCSTFAGR